MEEKLNYVSSLYIMLNNLQELEHKRNSIDKKVYNRSYTEQEMTEDERLEKSINLRRKDIEQKLTYFAKTFSSRKEIEELQNMLEKRKEQEISMYGTYDDREYSMKKGIISKVNSIFLSLDKNQNREPEER